MIIAIELNAAQSEQLKAIAASMWVPAEELAEATFTDLVGGDDAADFEAAASRALRKNHELHRRPS